MRYLWALHPIRIYIANYHAFEQASQILLVERQPIVAREACWADHDIRRQRLVEENLRRHVILRLVGASTMNAKALVSFVAVAIEVAHQSSLPAQAPNQLKRGFPNSSLNKRLGSSFQNP
jgi:hypothetical protein